MKYEEIKKIAEEIKSELSPLCKRVEIAGSIRRKKEEPRDIEIVAIPDSRKFFELRNYLEDSEKFFIWKGKFPGKYLRLQKIKEDVYIDLFLCIEETWGVIFVIRTGNAEFSRFLVTRARKIGYSVENGRIYEANKIFPFIIESERKVFKILKMEWIPPEQRNLTFSQYYEFTK